ncbi:MAG: hypothetical protein GY859_21565 [Desulfobacterales bacterium]|nr:hypothetical protein [Desulfobacterales bacterium]
MSNRAILMITPNFLNSGFMVEREVPLLLQKRARQGVRIIPLVVRPCAWESVGWPRAMNLRPRDGKPLSKDSDSDIDVDLTAFVKEIREPFTPVPPNDPIPTNPGSPARAFTSRLPVTGKELFGRERELEILDKALAGEKTWILTFMASFRCFKASVSRTWCAW